MGVRGRPRRPAADHELAGTLRADRHGTAEERWRADGRAEKPTGMGRWGAWLWDKVVDELGRREVAARIDTAALAAMCEWYQRYRQFASLLAKSNLADKETYRITIQTKMCWNEASKLMVEFGLTPAARSRLRIAPAKKAPGVASRKR